jgi:two-component system sensor histidine kinase RpfC
MPNRSGDEVVQALRFMETGYDFPIIMLTADATPEARKLSISYGVNEFLTKPIDSRKLLEKIAVISKSSRVHTVNAVAVAAEIESVVDSDDVLESNEPWCDEEILQELFMLDRDPTFMQRLVKGFINDGEKHVSRINDAVSDDYLQLCESLHALKGSASELGANRLADICKRGETYKPYDIGTEKLTQLSVDIEQAYKNTVETLNVALLSVEERKVAD